MSKAKRRWIDFNWSSGGCVRAQDIPYDGSYDIKTKIDSIPTNLNNFKSGVIDLKTDDTIKTIMFFDNFPNNVYTIGINITNSVDEVSSVFYWRAKNKTTGGFTIELMSPIDSDNYKMEWFCSLVYDTKTGIGTTWGVNGFNFGGSDGGSSNILYSHIDRIVFPFDTGNASLKGNLSATSYINEACNSSFHGYVVCSNSSLIDCITFPFDTGNASPDVALLSVHQGCGSFNSSSHGYTIAGRDFGGTSRSNSERFLFSFNTGIAEATSNYMQDLYVTSSCNSSAYGFLMGGIVNNGAVTISSIGRCAFPFTSGSAVDVGTLSSGISSLSGCNSSSYGFTFGGNSTTSDLVSSIERFTFTSTGSASVLGNLSGTRFGMGCCNSSQHGYVFGGATVGNTTQRITDRINFPFNSGDATVKGNLTQSVFYNAACEDFLLFW